MFEEEQYIFLWKVIGIEQGENVNRHAEKRNIWRERERLLKDDVEYNQSIRTST